MLHVRPLSLVDKASKHRLRGSVPFASVSVQAVSVLIELRYINAASDGTMTALHGVTVKLVYQVSTYTRYHSLIF